MKGIMLISSFNCWRMGYLLQLESPPHDENKNPALLSWLLHMSLLYSLLTKREFLQLLFYVSFGKTSDVGHLRFPFSMTCVCIFPLQQLWGGGEGRKALREWRLACSMGWPSWQSSIRWCHKAEKCSSKGGLCPSSQMPVFFLLMQRLSKHNGYGALQSQKAWRSVICIPQQKWGHPHACLPSLEYNLLFITACKSIPPAPLMAWPKYF